MATHRFEAAGLGTAPFEVLGMQTLKYQACPGAPIQPGGTCDYCGQSIIYAYAIRGADGRRFKVGCDCVLKTHDAGLKNGVKRVRDAHRRELQQARAVRSREAKRVGRERAARERRQRTRSDADAFARAHGLIPALRVALRGSMRERAAELLRQLRTLGSLSPAQVAFIKTLGTRLAPAPAGRVTFEATIESVKYREGHPRGSYKMTVRAAAGFRAWMTAPTALLATPGIGLERFRGARVTITATLEPSADDPGFAFGRRPTARLAAEGAPDAP